MSSLSDGQFAWAPIANLKYGSPLSKSASHLIVLCTSFAKAVETLSSSFFVCSSHDLETCVYLNTTLDSSFIEEVAELLAIFAAISSGFVEHNDSADVLLDAGSCEKQLSVGLSVFVIVLYIDSVESLTDSASGLIGS